MAVNAAYNLGVTFRFITGARVDFLKPDTAQLLSLLRIMSWLLVPQHGTTQVSRRADEQRFAYDNERRCRLIELP